MVGGVWLECGRGAGRSTDHSLFFFVLVFVGLKVGDSRL